MGNRLISAGAGFHHAIREIKPDSIPSRASRNPQAMGIQGRRVIEKDYNLKLSNQRLESLFQYTVNGHRQQEFAGARV